MTEYKEVQVVEIYRLNGWILFFTDCESRHAHNRPPKWNINIGDKMVCPVCYPDYPEGLDGTNNS